MADPVKQVLKTIPGIKLKETRGRSSSKLERQVARLHAQGASAAEIAGTLETTVGRVESIIARLNLGDCDGNMDSEET